MELARRVRPLIGLSLCGWAIFVVVGIVARSWLAAGINTVGMLGAAVFYALLPARPWLARPSAHFLSGVTVLCVFASAMLSGQTRSPAVWFLSVVPVAIGYLIGRRPAALWAVLCVLVGVAVEVTRRLYPIEPIFQITPLLLLVDLFVLILLSWALVSTATRLNEKHVQKLEQREATIRELLTGLEQQKEELLGARDHAIAASRAKSEFVATVSHEIRTPLNGVLGMAGVLLDEELSPRQRELVRTIRLSGDALLGIINDILDFSKIEADKLELETAPFDLRDLVEDAVELCAGVASKKGLELTATIAQGTPARVLGDGARVRQILVNLIGNAVKFTEQGEVAVTVSARGGTGAGAALRIVCAVRDTGIGVPEDGLRSLFVPFSQVDPSSTRRFGGTGLGLAISQRLAQAMGGGISVESAPGAGSTFTFTFRPEPQAVDSVPVIEKSGKRAGVLCARASTRAMLESLLRSLGFDAVSWESAEALRESWVRCDVLVCEEALHDEDVRDTIADAGTAVVLLTAQPRHPPAPTVPGVVGTLSKPVRRSDLRRALLGALGAVTLDTAPSAARLPALAPAIPLRLLVAEDNPINQRVAQLLLERLGYRADVVGNGVEALEAVAARPYDLVLMDVRMPEMDGIEATRRIRAELPRDRAPIIVAMTANATVEDREACRRVGMDDFLTKPIRPSDLIRVLRAMRGRAAREPQEDLLDHAALDAIRRLLASKPGELRSMMDDYLESAEQQLSNIDAALARGDADAVEMAAHSLKGVSGQMGARQVMAAAHRVEKAAAAGDMEGARALVPALRAAHETARPLLLDASGDRAPVSGASVREDHAAAGSGGGARSSAPSPAA